MGCRAPWAFGRMLRQKPEKKEFHLFLFTEIEFGEE